MSGLQYLIFLTMPVHLQRAQEVNQVPGIVGLNDVVERGHRSAIHAGHEDLVDILKHHVRTEIGPIATPACVNIVNDLPKTRSGKIMRRVIKAKVKGEPVGDISTLANPEAVDEIDKVLD